MTARLNQIKELIRSLSVEEFLELVEYVASAWDTTVKPQDSTGQLIFVGDRVRWREQIFTIKAFGERKGRLNSALLEFEEPYNPKGYLPPDEISVEKVVTP